jgi:hypothetical protein
MHPFSIATEELPLPKGATPQAPRIRIRWRDRPVLDLTQGAFRNYLYPVYSPAGVPLTAESPVDHPHHNSVTISADVVRALLPPLMPDLTDRSEEAVYNFYVNQVFQGRAPGRIWAVDCTYDVRSADHLHMVQRLQWQGPEEWGAADGRRTIAEEMRTIDIYPGEKNHVIDIRSQLHPTAWDLSMGPTRHGYFTIRMQDGLRPVDGGRVVDSEGRQGSEVISGRWADWVDMSGPAAHDQWAGLTVLPHPSTAGHPWIVFDWGTITVNPFLREQTVIRRGNVLDLGIRLLAHDGDVGSVEKLKS